MTLPNDPVILLSYINTQLRDFHPSLDDLCLTLGLDKACLTAKLGQIGYVYDKAQNSFR